MMMADDNELNTVELATELTIAWLSNPNTRVSADDVPAFLSAMHDAVTNLCNTDDQSRSPEEMVPESFAPAVSVRKSLASKDRIISLIDGKPYRALRGHLKRHGLTPQQYRERYNLKPAYPMVAENYSAARRETALRIGLGKKGRAAKAAVAPVAKPKARRTPRGSDKA